MYTQLTNKYNIISTGIYNYTESTTEYEAKNYNYLLEGPRKAKIY